MNASAIRPTSGNRSLLSNPPTILLVEDDPAVRNLVGQILRVKGYAVLKARHGAEALHFTVEYPGFIHLLLTDVCMGPYINGRLLAERIRAARPGIPVLYMSGFADDDEVAREVETGAAHFLSKPFTPHSLLDAVRKCVACPVG